MTSRKCFFIFITVSALLLALAGALVAYVDPFFHYHAPYTDRLYYRLDNERFQNDGIMKQFEYDALITGNSMAENFKVTELNELFGVNAVKVCYEGATLHEIDGALRTAFAHNDSIRLVVRALDTDRFWEYADQMNDDLFEYPDYLYNRNPFDDVEYLWNRDVLVKRVYPMVKGSLAGEPAGILPFDLYGYWMIGAVGRFGKDTVLAGRGPFTPPEEERVLPDYLPDVMRENIEQNVIALCREHPETMFYYFIPPYSALWWGEQWSSGSLAMRLASEKQGLQQMLDADLENLRIFSFSLDTDITLDLNNYIDNAHYGEWVNSYMLRQMQADGHRITSENLDAYIEEERGIYGSFDYNSLFSQEDREDQPAELSW